MTAKETSKYFPRNGAKSDAEPQEAHLRAIGVDSILVHGTAGDQVQKEVRHLSLKYSVR